MNDTPLPPTALAPQLQVLEGPAADTALAALALLKKEEAATEFTLFPDGSLAKWFPRPGFAPQVLLVDATGAQMGVLRNTDIGDLVCNALNLLVIASAKNHLDQQKIVQPGSPIILPGPSPIMES